MVQLAHHVRQKVGEKFNVGLSLKFALLVHQVKLAQWRRFMKDNTVPLKLIALLANGEFTLVSSWVKR